MSENMFLIVDDQEEINLLMAKFLSPYGECVVATNGKEAMHHFVTAHECGRKFTAVFLDIMMPGMDGHELSNKLRQKEREQNTPLAETFKLIMITALADTKNVCKSFFSGMADAYITKPINKDKLVSELKALGIVKED